MEHIKAHGAKYTAILGVFPLIFLANMAMPINMSFATAEQSNETNCRLAWIDYEINVQKLDQAKYRLAVEDTARNRDDVTKYNIDVEQALAAIDRFC